MMPTETIGFVMEKMRKIVSFAIAALAAGPCLPSASTQPIWPRRATITVAPGRVPLSISRLKASDMACRRAAERPIDSGFVWGRDGVCGAGLSFAAVCAVMVSSVCSSCCLLFVRLGATLAQKFGLEQGVLRNAPPGLSAFSVQLRIDNC